MKAMKSRKLVMLALTMLGLIGTSYAHHDHDHGGDQHARGEAATISLNISYGNIEFSNDYYWYTPSSGAAQVKKSRSASDVYEITGSANNSYTIKVGTPSTPVTNDVVIYLNGVSIYGPRYVSQNPPTPTPSHAAALYVNNNGSSTVYIVLKDGSDNFLKSYGFSDYVNSDLHYAHAGIEKELNTTGKLVVTCEAGYAAYKSNNNTGHTCSAGGTCGKLTAIGSADTYRTGGLRIFSGAGIGSAGSFQTNGGMLNNLIIAGGRITAYTMWDHLSGAPGNDAEDVAAFAPGIGTGSSFSANYVGASGYIKITGGRINSRAGNGAAACIGGGYRSGDITIDIYGGHITATERTQNHSNYSGATYRGAGIGVGGGGEDTGSEGIGLVNIYNGTITASSEYGAAIGGGAGGSWGSGKPATVNIYNGTITATTQYGAGAGIGTGGSTGSGEGGKATINISGGTINADSQFGADIGGGGTHSTNEDAKGGEGIVTITGGNITTTSGGIGGGKANAGKGGYATITIKGGIINTTSIGGGYSSTNDGGNATVTIEKEGSVAPSVTLSGGIGGGNSTSTDPLTTGNGGYSSVTVKAGVLTVAGKIGGGISAGSGNGGNASINVSGGELYCESVGGGDSNTGNPGSVSSTSGAGVKISGGTVVTGYIGGGANANGAIGKATAEITGGNIQGQFIMSSTSSTSSDHCYFTMTNGTIDNTNLGAIGAASYPRMKENGGAVFMDDQYGTVNISGGTIKNCSGSVNGGAIYMTNGQFTMSGGVLQENSCTERGGAVLIEGNGSVSVTGGTIGGTSLATGNKAGIHGGGIYMTGTFQMTGGHINYNECNGEGGGMCIGSGGSLTINGGEVKGNRAGTLGGGFYLNPGSAATTINSNVANTTICDNYAGNQGGGAFVRSGEITIASTNSHTTTIDNNTAARFGGGFLVNGGKVTLTGARITNNTATDRSGGGIYANGTVEITGGLINSNHADNGNGGGVFANNHVTITGGTVSNNTAVNGGGLYSNSGTVDFSSGTFSNNSVTGNGGGIYVASGATVQLSGNAIITKNHVPYASGEDVGHGGGIYLAGQVKVGRNASDPQGTHSLKVEDNYQDTEVNINNVYLPTNDNVIELISDVRGSNTKLGFSVNNGFRKVVYHANDAINIETSWLHGLLTEGGSQGLTGVIFDDSRKYMAVHVTTTTDQTFDHNYIYLWGCWISAVDTDPETDLVHYPLPTGTAHHYTVDSDGTWHIYTKYGLAWFSSYVNGLNAFTTGYNEDVNGAAKAVMEADVDMNEYLWVPLGSAASFDAAATDPTSAIFTDGHKFKGEFDGQGHTIRGLDCRYINSIHNYGLFGDVVGAAKISNTFVDDCKFSCSMETGEYVMGGIAGRASGTTVIDNCEARGTMASPESEVSVLGGLVGILGGSAQVHSSIGIPTLSGKALCMGGLAGQTAAGTSVKNSFANAALSTSKPTVTTLGGLVAQNSGIVENCYVRLNGDVPTSAHFGWLVGTNATGGQVNYCYSPVNGSYYYGTNSGTLTGYGHYANNTQVPYLYGRRDNQVTLVETSNPYYPAENGSDANPDIIASDKQMLLCLEHWVDTMNLKHGGHYAHWKRPTTKVINDDLPLLLMKGFDAVASTTGDAFIAYGLVNTLLGSYKSGTQAVWLYRNKGSLAGNGSSSAKFYIAEGVSVIPAASAAVNAYVGVTLDNSAGKKGSNATFGDGTPDYTDWHMFSSPLEAAPLGIHYTDNEQWGTQFSYDHPAGMPYYRFYDDDANHGYFPSMTYEWAKTNAYSAVNTSIDGNGNYYKEWDFYTYYEPEYHWVNFKRNSNSHWHQDIQDLKINYSNETNLKQGRGYLAATREETFLQCHGQLTDGEVTIPVTRDGYYSTGYNLLGNPYPSYLNFDEFARVNKVLWGGGTDADFTASYAVIDEDGGGYIYRAIRCSANPNTAPQYIAPHQGFMILAANVGTATFKNTMRDLDGEGGYFRGEEQPAYPLVNLIATDGNSNRDITTVELGRPDKGGAPLMRDLKMATSHVYSRYDDKDWAIAFTQPGVTEVPIRFEAYADGEYTLRWNTQNGEFHYLHLIDNLTGADINCLATDEYRFASTTTDYKSRFRLVFGYTGIDEPETDEPIQGSFAYQSGDELVVTGEGTVELFDVTGRRMSAERIEGVQGTMSVSGLTPGVYLLRLATATGTRVQKIVINQ